MDVSTNYKEQQIHNRSKPSSFDKLGVALAKHEREKSSTSSDPLVCGRAEWRATKRRILNTAPEIHIRET